jgi:Ca2+-binding EF-hand superfamily protein
VRRAVRGSWLLHYIERLELETGATMGGSDAKSKANAAFKKGDWKAAVKFYSLAIEKDRSSHLLYSNRAASYLKLGDYKLALKDADKVIELDPWFSKGYGRKGAALHAMKQYDAAIKVYTEGLKHLPKEDHLIKGLASCKKARVNVRMTKTVRKASVTSIRQERGSQRTIGAPTVSLFLEATRKDLELQLQALQAKLELTKELGNLNDEQKADLCFTLIDKDGDGTIDFAELASALRLRNAGLSVAESFDSAITTMKQFDQDGNSRLDAQEFYGFLDGTSKQLNVRFNEFCEFLVLQILSKPKQPPVPAASATTSTNATVTASGITGSTTYTMSSSQPPQTTGAVAEPARRKKPRRKQRPASNRKASVSSISTMTMSIQSEALSVVSYSNVETRPPKMPMRAKSDELDPLSPSEEFVDETVNEDDDEESIEEADGELFDILMNPQLGDLFQLYSSNTTDGGKAAIPFKEVALAVYQLSQDVDETARTAIKLLLMMDLANERLLDYSAFGRFMLAIVAAASSIFNEIAEDLLLIAENPADESQLQELVVQPEVYEAAIAFRHQILNEDGEDIQIDTLSYARLQKLFDLWDEDGDSGICHKELVAELKRFQCAAEIKGDAEQVAQEILTKFDKDGDQELQLKEFVRAMVHYAKAIGVDIHDLIDFMTMTSQLSYVAALRYQSAFSLRHQDQPPAKREEYYDDVSELSYWEEETLDD